MVSGSDNVHFGTHATVDDSRNASIRIYVNGDIVPRDEAKVSVYDSGFMLGDGVWEGLRLHNGKFLFADLHLDRLFAGAKAIDLDIGKSKEELLAALRQTIEIIRANDSEKAIKILVGGLAFVETPDLWERVGADGYAPSAHEAVEVGRRLLGLAS